MDAVSPLQHDGDGLLDDGDEDVPPYGWGEAVLATTYRGLCDGCMKTHRNAILAGCPLLLQAPFFYSKDFVANLKEKKLQLEPVAPHRATGGIFEIFQNRHIFLKF